MAAQEVMRRIWKNFCYNSYREAIKEIDWSDFYDIDNLDVMNSLFEEKVSNILNQMAPMKNIQLRKKYRNWVDEEIKDLMRRWDLQKISAKQTDNSDNWVEYTECLKNNVPPWLPRE